MYETLTTPRGPAPFIRVHNPPGPTIARWKIHRSRRKREKEVFQDWRRFPWRAERQAQKGVSLYYRTAVMVDEDVARVPLGQRVNNPPSGNYPTVVGVEEGPGPHPWFGKAAHLEDVQRRNGNQFGGDMRGPAGPVTKPPAAVPLNEADYEDGPESRPSIYAGPVPPPVDMADNAIHDLRIVTSPDQLSPIESDTSSPISWGSVMGMRPPSNSSFASSLATRLRSVMDEYESSRGNTPNPVQAAAAALGRLATQVNRGNGRRAGARGSNTSASNRSPSGEAGHTSTLLTSAVQGALNSGTVNTLETGIRAARNALRRTGIRDGNVSPRSRYRQNGGAIARRPSQEDL